jgi:hypothetical protein
MRETAVYAVLRRAKGYWMLDTAVYAVLRRAKGYWMRVSFTPRRQAAKILSARLCEVFDLLA